MIINNQNPFCFVVMGFGRRADPGTGRIIDLDVTYEKIIQPALEQSDFDYARADDLLGTGSIVRSMYALLYRADLVIADISTFNPNALYELGMRHVFKPGCTVVLMESRCAQRSGANSKQSKTADSESKSTSGEGEKEHPKLEVPFDIVMTRVVSYEHLGERIDEDEARDKIGKLKATIAPVKNAFNLQLQLQKEGHSLLSRFKRLFLIKTKSPVLIDSPLYEYFKDTKPPVISDEEFAGALILISKNESLTVRLRKQAKDYMRQGKFTDAAKIWQRLHERLPNNIYCLQQLALCTYKSKSPGEREALLQARKLLESIEDQRDSETQGLLGSIYKHLWLLDKSQTEENHGGGKGNGGKQSPALEYLYTATDYYQCGWANNYTSYYCLENYATCQVHKALVSTDAAMALGLFAEAENKYRLLIELVLPQVESDRTSEEKDEKLAWKYAALANSFFYIKEFKHYQLYLGLFLSSPRMKWYHDSFYETYTVLITAVAVRLDLQQKTNVHKVDVQDVVLRHSPPAHQESYEQDFKEAPAQDLSQAKEIRHDGPKQDDSQNHENKRKPDDNTHQRGGFSR